MTGDQVELPGIASPVRYELHATVACVRRCYGEYTSLRRAKEGLRRARRIHGDALRNPQIFGIIDGEAVLVA